MQTDLRRAKLFGAGRKWGIKGASSAAPGLQPLAAVRLLSFLKVFRNSQRNRALQGSGHPRPASQKLNHT